MNDNPYFKPNAVPGLNGHASMMVSYEYFQFCDYNALEELGLLNRKVVMHL